MESNDTNSYSDLRAVLEQYNHQLEDPNFSDMLQGLDKLFANSQKANTAEQRLFDNELRFNNVEQIANIGSWEYFFTEKTIYWSDNLYHIFDLNPLIDIVDSSTIISMTHIEDRKTVDRTIKQAIEKGIYFLCENRIIRKNGEIRYVTTKGNIIFDCNKKPIKLIGSIHDITDQKQSNIAIEEIKERYKFLFNQTQDGIILHKNGICIDLNESFLNIFEIKREDVVGMPFIEKTIHRTNQQLIKNLTGCQSPQSKTISVNTANEKKILVECNTRSIQHEGLEVQITVLRDISDKKKAEQDVTTRDAYLRVISYIQAYILKFDKEIEYEKILSWLGKLSKSDYAYYFTSSSQTFAQKATWHNPKSTSSFERKNYIHEYTPLLEIIKNGSNIYYSHNEPHFLDNTYIDENNIKAFLIIPIIVKNRTYGYIGFEKISNLSNWHELEINLLQTATSVITQFEEKQLAQRALIESEEKLGIIFDNAPVGIAYVKNQKIALANFKFEALLCGASGDFLSKDNTSFLNRSNINDHLIEEYREKLSQNHNVSVEIELKKHNGEKFWCKLVGQSIHQETEDEGEIWIIEDITERKKVLNQLKQAKINAEQANIAKSAFLANMSHEIKTPMNAIIGFSDVLNEEIVEPCHKNYAQSIKSSSEILMKLISDILDLSKIEVSGIELTPTVIHIGYMIEDIINIFEPKALDKSLKLTQHIQPGLPENIFIDELRLKQILMNLTGNAIKFTNEGHIDFNINYNIINDKLIDLQIKISDTGIGIKNESLQYIFDPFTQQDNYDSRKYEGTGLGLSITKHLVELMNGTISVSSEVNKGSTFLINLPELKFNRDSNNKTQITTESNNLDFEGKKILVVDDIKINRDVLLAILMNKGLTILQAESGSQALEIIQNDIPDLVLMDIKMPGLNGFLTTNKIKNNPNTKKIPVIAITAMLPNAPELQKQRAVFDEVIHKPLKPKALFSKISTYFAPKQPDSLIRFDDIENITALYHELKELKENEWQKAMQGGNFKKYNAFAEKILQLATEYQVDYLKQFASEIKQYTISFDIENMNRKLNEFPRILINIEKKSVGGC
ncbi:PAS domain S-box protein [Bacteroidales bacterium]|nr:PAS domain S-box protein [Bacteroidales bacterium]